MGWVKSHPFGGFMITLATMANRNWYEFVAIAIQSVIDNNSDFKLYLFIEDDSFPWFKNDKRIIVKNFNNMPKLLDDNSPNIKGMYPKISFLPFCLPFWLDDKKVIFFDSDVVFDGSLKNLWESGLGNCYAALVPEPQKSIDHIYGNMGVALLNLDKMRKDNIHTQLLNKLNTEFYLYICQDILNEVCADRIAPLSNKWNATHWTGFPETIIGCHGAGNIKPWDSRSRYYNTCLKYKDSLCK